jgi:RimJ/RimL family protein N-acetyltransferase
MFTGDLVTLGVVQREYLPSYVKWLNDWELRRLLAPNLPHPYTMEDEEGWFNRLRDERDSRVFAVLTNAEGRLLGNCSLHRIDWTNRHAMFGIFIGDKNDRRKGYGRDATRVLLRYAFEEAGLNRIELEVFSFNTSAIRLYEKVGFRMEGTRRQALFREGAWHDEHIMAILRDDWIALYRPS